MNPFILGAAHAVLPGLARGIGNAASNAFGAAGGNAYSRAATAGGMQQNINPVTDYSQQVGSDYANIYGNNVDRSRQMAEQDARAAQGYGIQNAAFRRGLEADRMRQETFNSMGINDQNNRANAAASLLDSYNQARSAAIQMATNSLY